MKTLKKIMASLLAVATVVSALGVSSVDAQAASKKKSEPVVAYTTQACTIWTAPDTHNEANRGKKLTAGYKVTVYKDVIKSTAGDGKTFYKTSKGAYILCKCITFDANAAVTTPTANTSVLTGDLWTVVKSKMDACSYYAYYYNVNFNKVAGVGCLSEKDYGSLVSHSNNWATFTNDLTASGLINFVAAVTDYSYYTYGSFTSANGKWTDGTNTVYSYVYYTNHGTQIFISANLNGVDYTYAFEAADAAKGYDYGTSY